MRALKAARKKARSVARAKRDTFPDTQKGRVLAFLKRFHPKMYRGLLIKRPDLIKDAFSTGLSGIDGLSGWLDDITNFGQKALDLYKQQETFKAQIKQASATPVRTVQTAPLKVQRLNPQFDAYTEERLKTTGTVFGSLIPVGIGAGVALLILKLWPKKKRR